MEIILINGCRAERSWLQGGVGSRKDLSTALADFNADKTVPLTLGGTIAETPTEAGVEAGITGWETIDGGGVDAEM